MAELPILQKNLPPDIQIEKVMDTSDHIKTSINSLLETIFLALIIVGIIVLFFLGRWRATIIIMVTIPISLIGSFIYLYITGNTINIISPRRSQLPLVWWWMMYCGTRKYNHSYRTGVGPNRLLYMVPRRFHFR